MIYLILCVFAVGWFLAAYLGYRIGECPLPPVAKVVTPEIPWLGPAKDLAQELGALRASLAAERVASDRAAQASRAAVEKLHGGLEGLQLLLAQSAARVGEAQASRRGAVKEKGVSR